MSQLHSLRPHERLIVALDCSEAAAAVQWTRRLRDHIGLVKIGLELFVAEGPRVVHEINDLGVGIFLDLKFHDIPNTVAGAVRSAGRLGVKMLNVHAGGGVAMLQAAALAAEESPTQPLLLGVTVLTSLHEESLRALGIAGPIPERVVEWARLCQTCNLGGVVASALEAAPIRRACGPDFAIVTPGIRASQGARHDQVRVATPASARRNGADYVVVGRAITGAPDPVAAAQAMAEELGGVTPEMAVS